MMQIKIVHSIESARDIWRALEEQGICYVFQTYDWLATWMETIGQSQGTQCHIVLVTAEDGRPLMLIPLGISRRYGLTWLEFLDGGVSDYNAPIISPDFICIKNPETFRYLWNCIVKQLPKVDIIALRKIPEAVESVQNPFLHLGCNEHDQSAHYTLLSGSYSDFLKSRDAKHRRSLARRRRRLEEIGNIKFQIASDSTEIEEFFSTLLHEKLSKYPHAIIGQTAHQAFYKTLAQRHASEGAVSLSALHVKGEIMAVRYGVCFKKRIYLLVAAYKSSEWEKFSPGSLLMENLIEWLYDNRFSVLDLCIGDEEFKHNWADKRLKIYNYYAARSIKGRIGLPIFMALQRMKYVLKERA